MLGILSWDIGARILVSRRQIGAFRIDFKVSIPTSCVARDKPSSTLRKKSHGIPSSPRAAAVAKFRLLSGHDCLYAHLFRFNLVTSPICVLCDTGQDMTAAHLDECSALNDLNCICNNRIVVAQRKHLDDFLRGGIIGRQECGRTQLDVSDELGIAQSIITRLWQRFQDDGNSVTMTGHIYRDVILEQHVCLFRGAMGTEFLFMDGNARPHRASIEDECL
ncbi:uncharacterized protein TNCV_4726601 [Trichonephila clavipes]|nr:uncharacterized protein TNCV_4726601 [Trichonephila clavipes]